MPARLGFNWVSTCPMLISVMTSLNKQLSHPLCASINRVPSDPGIDEIPGKNKHLLPCGDAVVLRSDAYPVCLHRGLVGRLMGTAFLEVIISHVTHRFYITDLE